MKDLNKLSKEIYEANKAKGFHDKEHSVEHMMCLVISELMEAVEADREGNKVDYNYEEDGLAYTTMEDNEFKDWYECTTKGSVEEELADAVIRLLDTAGALEFKIVKLTNIDHIVEMNSRIFNSKSFTEIIFSICGILYSAKIITGTKIRVCIEAISALCRVRDIGLWQHVDMKLKYNKLRPYKHGKKY